MTNKFYSREILKRIAKLIAPLISKIEGKPSNHIQIDGEFQPIFIIGAPRTGSTILYQILSNELDLIYFDNLTDIFHRNLLWAFKISDRLFNGKPHNCFKSIHGSTWKCGLHAPSECGDFWYQWLSREYHFIDNLEIKEDTVNDIQYNLYSVINTFQKHFIMKNLNAGQRLRLLKKVCPDAKFIFVVRDKIDTAMSILNSRKKSGVKKGEWWSVKPKNFDRLLKLNEHDMIIQQIYYLEKQISEDLKLFPLSNSVVIDYCEICDNYIDAVDKIKKLLPGDIRERDNRKKPVIKLTKNNIDNSDSELFEEYYKKLNWDEINFS